MAGTTWPVHKGARRWSIVCLKSAEKEVGQSLSSDRYWGWFRIEPPPPPPERCPSASSGALRQWVGLEAHQEARPVPTVVLQYCCCCGLLGERRPALPDALTRAGSSRGCPGHRGTGLVVSYMRTNRSKPLFPRRRRARGTGQWPVPGTFRYPWPTCRPLPKVLGEHTSAVVHTTTHHQSCREYVCLYICM